MSDAPPEEGDRAGGPDRSDGEDDYARAYSEGYGEGLREGLKELLQHASRGHTAQELRILVESRLARVSEDVELKRRSLVHPPRRPAWGSLLRAPRPPEAWVPLRSPLPLSVVTAGQTVLLREERPARALELFERSAPEFPRVVVVSFHPPTFSPSVAARAEIVRVGGSSDGASGGGLSPGEIGGRIREATEAAGGALVYFDAFEFLATEYSLETALKFVHWATAQAIDHRSAFLACVDPKALDAKDL
ncbi:MAG TPA: hypothetical protein VLY85_02365, partial [Thermoplasmata archaeon]|nr:hypothetical protein [Thermoplasmata archaeon]